MTRRQERINSLLRTSASSFIKTYIGSGAVVTATKAEISPDLRLAKIFVSVFPEEKENEILRFLKEREREFKNFLKSNIRMKFLPRVFFEIDKREKIERRIDELLKK